ncbi:hypothetical protein Vretifemale_19229 [Volvox reticuliferus]|nr:hypothetical protein Vretifemale_19229 [Volvox reticuliferus]
MQCHASAPQSLMGSPCIAVQANGGSKQHRAQVVHMVWPTITRPHSPTCIALAAETMRTLAAQRARATLARVDGSVAGSSAAVDTASSEDTEISLRGVKALRACCGSSETSRSNSSRLMCDRA